MYKSLAEIKAANEAYAKREGRAYWFSSGATNFFKSSYRSTVYHGHFFITGETDPSGLQR